MSSPDPQAEARLRGMLDLFYRRARDDAALGPVFARAVGTTDAEWAPHMERIADFWSSLVWRTGRYGGDPFSVHLRLPDLEPAMFDRWLALFRAACDEALPPEEAAAFGERAMRIARSLRMGLFERLPQRSS